MQTVHLVVFKSTGQIYETVICAALADVIRVTAFKDLKYIDTQGLGDNEVRFYQSETDKSQTAEAYVKKVVGS